MKTTIIHVYLLIRIRLHLTHSKAILHFKNSSCKWQHIFFILFTSLKTSHKKSTSHLTGLEMQMHVHVPRDFTRTLTWFQLDGKMESGNLARTVAMLWKQLLCKRSESKKKFVNFGGKFYLFLPHFFSSTWSEKQIKKIPRIMYFLTCFIVP